MYLRQNRLYRIPNLNNKKLLFSYRYKRRNSQPESDVESVATKSRVTFDTKTGKLVATDAHCHSPDAYVAIQMACTGFVCGPVDE